MTRFHTIILILLALNLNAESSGLLWASCPGDLDGSGFVEVDDVLNVLSSFGCDFECGNSDLNNDGIVGIDDVLLIISLFGQPCEDAFDAPVVTSDSTYGFSIDTAIVYGTGLSHETWNSDSFTTMPLLLDAYIPEGAGENRPVIVIIHGGGFTGGSRSGWRPVAQAQYFASRGWVAFSIDYRLLSDRGTVPQQWVDYVVSAGADSDSVSMAQVEQSIAIYPAHRDAKAALRWVAENAENYSINMGYMTVGGGSAGAITSVGVSVTDPGDFRDELSNFEDPTILTTNLNQSYVVSTILDFWGAPTSVNLLQSVYEVNRFDTSDPPLFIAHGTEDPVVNFSNAMILKETWESIGVPYVFYPLEGEGHGPWNSTVIDTNGESQSLYELAFDFVVSQQELVVE